MLRTLVLGSRGAAQPSAGALCTLAKDGKCGLFRQDRLRALQDASGQAGGRDPHALRQAGRERAFEGEVEHDHGQGTTSTATQGHTLGMSTSSS